MKKLTSVFDEYAMREKLRKTRQHMNAHINLAAALMEPKPWVGLTDEGIDELACAMVKGNKSVNWLCRAIEAKLRQKNT